MSYKKEYNNYNSRCPYGLCGNSLLPSLYPMVKSIEKRIQSSSDPIDTARVRHLNNFKNSLNKIYKYGFSSILDDKMISL